MKKAVSEVSLSRLRHLQGIQLMGVDSTPRLIVPIIALQRHKQLVRP